MLLVKLLSGCVVSWCVEGVLKFCWLVLGGLNFGF